MAMKAIVPTALSSHRMAILETICRVQRGLEIRCIGGSWIGGQGKVIW
jgi:hypothetical protein